MTLRLTRNEQEMKKKRNVLSKKEELSQVVKKIAKKSKSLMNFEEKLLEHNLNVYYRKNKLCGINIEGKKYRLTTLGIDNNQIKTLTKEQERLNQLLLVRSMKNIDKELNKN